MPQFHTEIVFEAAIEQSLLEIGGYIQGNSTNYNKDFGIDAKQLFAFLQKSKAEKWDKLQIYYNHENNQVRTPRVNSFFSLTELASSTKLIPELERYTEGIKKKGFHQN